MSEVPRDGVPAGGGSDRVEDPAFATIFVCSDRAYLPGAIVALSSILRHNRAAVRNCRICAFLSEDAMPTAAPIIERIAAGYGLKIEAAPASRLGRVHSGFRNQWGFLSPGYGLSDAAYYRVLAALWLAEQDAPGRALYLDSDACVGSGIADLLRFDLRGRPLAARLEEADWPGVRKAARRMGVPSDTYFNSGVLVLDLAHAATAPALRRALTIAIEARDRLTFGDQCALNAAFQDGVQPLPAIFNRYVRSHAHDDAVRERALVTHYLGAPKPWDPAYPGVNNALWLNEFCALAEVLTAQQMRKLLAIPFDAVRGTSQDQTALV